MPIIGHFYHKQTTVPTLERSAEYVPMLILSVTPFIIQDAVHLRDGYICVKTFLFHIFSARCAACPDRHSAIQASFPGILAEDKPSIIGIQLGRVDVHSKNPERFEVFIPALRRLIVTAQQSGVSRF